jgi:hypothetical protein
LARRPHGAQSVSRRSEEKKNSLLLAYLFDLIIKLLTEATRTMEKKNAYILTGQREPKLKLWKFGLEPSWEIIKISKEQAKSS